MILTDSMSQWLDNMLHERGLYHMMYDKDSIAVFGEKFELDSKQAKSAINDWYSQRGD